MGTPGAAAPPACHRHSAAPLQLVNYDRRPPLDALPSSCPSSMRKLIKACWRRNPRERPSAAEVVRKIGLIQKTGQLQG